MSISTSVLSELMQALPQLRSQIYFKASLIALSHAMEDQVLASSEQPLLIASFQRERFYRQEAHRYRRIAQRTDQLYVLAAPETDFTNASDCYETVAFDPTDSLSQEWHLVVIAQHYAICLVCRERQGAIARRSALNSSLATPSPAQGNAYGGSGTADKGEAFSVAPGGRLREHSGTRLPRPNRLDSRAPAQVADARQLGTDESERPSTTSIEIGQ